MPMLRGKRRMAKLVYIGGYGHSGTTLVEYLLSTSPAVLACGEIAVHLRRDGDKICTCGRRVQDCSVWGAFQHSSGKLAGWDHRKLTLGLFEHVSGRYPVMVDSSKTAWGCFLMPLRLRKHLGQDFFLVHIIRDPRAVCWSTIKKLRRGMPSVRCLRTAIGWTLANLSCEIFGWLSPDQYLRVSYEDLTQDTENVLRRIFDRLSLRASTNLDGSSGTADNRHQLYGNRTRRKPLAPYALKQDIAWKIAMPRRYRLLAGGLCWPLGFKYGYMANPK